VVSSNLVKLQKALSPVFVLSPSLTLLLLLLRLLLRRLRLLLLPGLSRQVYDAVAA